VLFLAVPDEENNSAGARRAANVLPEIAAAHDLDIVAAINLDAIADDGDGEDGRVIALGTIGKLLPTAMVVGTPTHSGFPLNGVNAGFLAAAIAARLEWATELTEALPGSGGTPPSLLSLRDGKAGYDVTTPATAFATFNVLSYSRSPDEVLSQFDQLCGQAVADAITSLQERSARQMHSSRGTGLPDRIPTYRYETVEAAALAREQANRARIEAYAQTMADLDVSLPEKCRLVTEHVWALSGLSGPAVVTGFGSIPYLPTKLSGCSDAKRLEAVATRMSAESESRYGATIRCVDHFKGISDMSFLGEADEADLKIVARNTPMWTQAVRWPRQNGIANVPTINIGPWGRDYHTSLERLHTPYAFDVLPRLLFDVASAVLNGK